MNDELNIANRGRHGRAWSQSEHEPPPQDWSEFAHWLAAAVLVAVIAAAVWGWVR